MAIRAESSLRKEVVRSEGSVRGVSQVNEKPNTSTRENETHSQSEFFFAGKKQGS